MDMDSWGSILGRGENFLFSIGPKLTLGYQPSLLSKWYLEIFPLGRGKGRSVKLTTHLHLGREWWSYAFTAPYVFMA
jgi:hypothetical protein